MGIFLCVALRLLLADTACTSARCALFLCMSWQHCLCICLCWLY